MERFAIAIDGPAGSGKSTAAKETAKRLGMVYVDTGAMYRTVALACMRAGVSVSDEAAALSVLNRIDMRIEPEQGGQRIFLDGKDVTAEIRTPEIGKGASEVAAFRKVRERLVEIQQELARKYPVVMDGRDIGTVVLPDAELKIYLDAGVEERARRRQGELREQGKTEELSEVMEKIRQRDEADKTREHSPLRMANDAILLDSTGMSAEEVVQAILAEAEKLR
ncbi:MAG: (d)CMP kinase [Anaerotignum sp.]|jgi:cytidylate kinase|nr:(d)CMP kinase [Anaerotignum sp.]MCI8868118.1 (d)CMP kinase [Anaerotignum sp.]